MTHRPDREIHMAQDLTGQLADRVVEAAEKAFGIDITADQAVIRPAGAGRGADFQSNAAMPLARTLKKPSRVIGDQIAAHLDTTGLDAVEVAGPGFINLTLGAALLNTHTLTLVQDPGLGIVEQPPRRVVVDYSSPNMAKEMHVGHLRSTIIGDALARILQTLGHTVIRQNHLGDWGTPFGMLVEHMIDHGQADGAGHNVANLTDFYVAARTKFDTDAAFAERARKRVVALQAGDPDTLALWRRLLDESKRHMEDVYQLLDVLLTPDDYRGESAYNTHLADVAEQLQANGLAVTSDGALCVFPPGFTGRNGEPLPLIVRKRDGGYGYAATDLATIRHRAAELKADQILYVVGAPQKNHFDMVFAVAAAARWLPDTQAVHVPFGSVQGANGKTLRTREDGTLKLTDLLTEAVDRAKTVIADRTNLDTQQQQTVAHAVGIGAIKYADLSNSRDKDYTYDPDRMLAMDGNTAVYLQYAHARIQSVLAKTNPFEPDADIHITHDAERALALTLDAYSAAVASTADHLEPHRLCTYLYDLATTFSTFYENCPIIKATEPTRSSRLRLAQHTANVLSHGLGLLGITAPTKL